MPQSIRPTSLARTAVFTPLVGAGRAELVAQRLSDAIVLGVLPDGERLPSESELARQFGVAVATAREALETLRDAGLLATRRGRDGGSFVTFTGQGRSTILSERVRSIARVDLRDMGIHYSAIAGMAAELAADRAGEADVANLTALVGTIDPGTESATRKGLGRFRLEVAALSQSARLAREEIRLQAEFGPLLWLCLQDQDYRDRSHARMTVIVRAIADLDMAGARRETTEHIGEAIDWLIETTSSPEPEGASQ